MILQWSLSNRCIVVVEMSKAVGRKTHMTLGRERLWGYMVKKLSAHGECLGSKRR